MNSLIVILGYSLGYIVYGIFLNHVFYGNDKEKKDLYKIMNSKNN